MSSSVKLGLLIGGLILFGAGLWALFFARGEARPLHVPLEKNEGRLVAAIVPVPKSSVTPTPSPSPSPTVSPSPTASPNETPPQTPTPGTSPTPRPTPFPTPVRTPVEPTPFPTRQPTPFRTPTPTPTRQPTPKRTPRSGPSIGDIFNRIRTFKTPTPTPKPKPTQTPRIVIGEMEQETAPGFWDSLGESVRTAFGYLAEPTSAQAAEAAPDETPRETIDLSYPTEIPIKGSGTIELKIARTGTPASAAKNGKAALGDSTIELETDRCPPESALSACLADHETRVVASLVGSGFEIAADGAQNTPKKIGAGANPVWRWSIKPKSGIGGDQEMFLTLNFTWTKGGETLGPDSSRPRDFKVNVTQSLFEWGTISIASLILSMLGPILTLPWFYERGKAVVKYYRERGQKKDSES